MATRDDSAEIKRALTDRLESLISHYFPSAVFRGRSAFPEPKDARDLGSFEVILSGPQRGTWFRRSQGIGGDPICLIAYAVTGDHKAYREAFAEAKAFLGLPEQKTRPRAPVSLPTPSEDEGRESRRKDAYRLWKASQLIAGTLGETYLRSRGIPFDLSSYTSLRFNCSVLYDHPDWYHKRLRLPAVVAVVVGPDLRFRAVWRIFLGNDGGKAECPSAKLGMGPARGGAVWLGKPGESVNACEGLETGLGVRGLTGERESVACLLSTSGMRGWEPPPIVKSVRIWPDGDRNRIQVTKQGERVLPSPGLSAAEALRERLIAQGLECSIEPTWQSGRDALDHFIEWQKLRERDEQSEIQTGAAHQRRF